MASYSHSTSLYIETAGYSTMATVIVLSMEHGAGSITSLRPIKAPSPSQLPSGDRHAAAALKQAQAEGGKNGYSLEIQLQLNYPHQMTTAIFSPLSSLQGAPGQFKLFTIDQTNHVGLIGGMRRTKNRSHEDQAAESICRCNQGQSICS